MTAEIAVPVPVRGEIPARDRVAVLFDAHHQRLYALARRMSPTAEDARDLVQETFLRAARSPGSIPQQERSEEAWLVRVLVNLCRDRWRQTAIRRRLSGIARSRNEARAGDAEAPFVARLAVWDALRKLPPRRRAVIVMHEIEGASTTQIAALLGVTAVTVRWHLARGRMDLRKALAGRSEE